MNKHYLSFLLFSIFFTSYNFSLVKPVTSKDLIGIKDTKIDDAVQQFPSAIKIGIIDGIVKYINNEQRIKVSLQWIPLSVTENLVEQASSKNFAVVKLRISNKELKSDSWFQRLKQDEKNKVLNAFNVDSINQLLTSLNEKRESQDLFNSLTDGSLNIPEYLRMRRDRNIIRALINSEGVEYSFGVKSKEREILPPEYSNENIIWHIDIYQFNENHYRFTAKVVVEPFEVRLTNDVLDNSNPKEPKTFYDTRFKLKKIPPGFKPDKIAGSSSSVVVPPPQVDKSVDDISTELKKSLLPLSGFLSIFGG
jgi:hypothetical protein